MVEKDILKDIRKVVKKKYNPDMDINRVRSKVLKELRETFDGRVTYGGYAGVFIPKDKNFVVKIIFRGEDEAYSNYARYAKRYAHKFSILPVIYDSYKTDLFEVYVLERLKHNSRKASSFSKSVFYEYSFGVDLIAKRSHEFYPVLKKIHRLCSASVDQMFDAYDNNIMVRPNGTLVITDPVG